MTASPPAARLAFLLGIALVDVALAAALLTAVLGLVGGVVGALPHGPALLVGLALLLALFLVWRTLAPLRVALAVPAARLAAPELPVGPAELAPLRVAGLLLLATLPLHLLSLPLTGGAPRVIGGLQLLLALALAVGALTRSAGARLPSPTEARAHPPLGPGLAERLTETLLQVGILAAAGAMVGWALALALGRPEALALGAEVGSLLGLLRAPLAPGSRRALLVGLGVDTVLGLLLGPLPTALLAAAAVVLDAWRAGEGRQALAQGWRFALASALGRLLGTAVGLFLLGPSGRTVGEVAGERLLAVILLGSRRAEG